MLAPTCDFAGAIAEDLIKQGFAIIRHFTDERAKELLRRNVSATGSELPWRRSTSTFSEIVLGSGSDTEILKFDEFLEFGPKHLEMASARDGRDCIQPLIKICQALQHVTERALGFRSTGDLAEVMLRKGAASISSGSILSLPQEHDIAEQLYFLRKRRLCMMSFIACEPGSMFTLTPSQPELGWQGVKMEVVEGMILIFRQDLLSYSYRPRGIMDLAVQAWIMEQDNLLKLEPIEGNNEDVMNFVGHVGFELPLPGDDTPHIIGIGGSISHHHGPNQWYQASSTCCDSPRIIPQIRWDMDMYYSPDLADGLSWCKHGALFDMRHLDAFDNDFWNMQTGHVQKIMRGKLKSLEAGYEAAHGSGFTRATLRNAPIAVGMGSMAFGIMPDDFVSMGTETTDHLLDPGFVSYHLGLTGRSMLLDTACSATMCVTHEVNKDMMISKCGHLHKLRDYGIANRALVIGSLIIPGPAWHIGLSQARMMGSAGRSMSFDVTANGFGVSECVMGFYMCRESTNWIAGIQRAHVIGTSTNQDGRSASLTAPNGPAQTTCIRQCSKNSGTTPQETTVNQPHCTGTKLGDPIELGSTRAAFFSKSEDRPRPLSHCAFKSLTGHCVTAAGAPAIVQMVMSLQYAKVPPNCHLYEFNDNAPMSGYPALVGNEEYDLSMNASIIGLTGMGFGGSNARVELMGTCKDGIRAIPPIMPLFSRTIAYVDRAFSWKLQAADLSYVLNACAICSGDMCFQCGMGFVTADDYHQAHICSHVREASATYDVCSLCYQGQYITGSAPSKIESGNPGNSFHLVGSWDSWSCPKLMEQVTDEHGDTIYVSTAILDVSSRAEFRFLLEAKHDNAIYPSVNYADASARVLGPDSGHADRRWRIDGRNDGMLPGSLYTVQLKWNYDGKAVAWKVADVESYGSIASKSPRFSILGSWTGWMFEKMTCTHRAASMEECEIDVMIGTQRKEEFYFVQGKDRTQAIFPSTFETWSESELVSGPSANSDGNAWIIRGRPGEMGKIKLNVTHEVGGISICVSTITIDHGERVWTNHLGTKNRNKNNH